MTTGIKLNDFNPFNGNVVRIRNFNNMTLAILGITNAISLWTILGNSNGTGNGIQVQASTVSFNLNGGMNYLNDIILYQSNVLAGGSNNGITSLLNISNSQIITPLYNLLFSDTITCMEQSNLYFIIFLIFKNLIITVIVISDLRKT